MLSQIIRREKRKALILEAGNWKEVIAEDWFDEEGNIVDTKIIKELGKSCDGDDLHARLRNIEERIALLEEVIKAQNELLNHILELLEGLVSTK